MDTIGQITAPMTERVYRTDTIFPPAGAGKGFICPAAGQTPVDESGHFGLG